MEYLFIIAGFILWIIGGILFYKGVYRIKQKPKREG